MHGLQIRASGTDGLDADEKKLLGYAIYFLRKNSKTFNKEFEELHSSKMIFTVGKSSRAWGQFNRQTPNLEGGDEDEDGIISPISFQYDMSDGAKGGEITVDLDLFKQLKKDGTSINVQETITNVLPEEFSGAALFLSYLSGTNGSEEGTPQAGNIEFESKLLSGIILYEAGKPLSNGESQKAVEQFGIDYYNGNETLNSYFNALQSWHINPKTSPKYRKLRIGKSVPGYINRLKKQ